MKRLFVFIALVVAAMTVTTEAYAVEENAVVVSPVVEGDETAVQATFVEPSDSATLQVADSVAVVENCSVEDESAMERLTRF